MWKPPAQAVQAQFRPVGFIDSLPACSEQAQLYCHAIANNHFCAAFAEWAVNPVDLVVNKGTVGHPHSCAAACKYAQKKGCKDGASCDRCHLCQWRRSCERKPRKVRSRWEGQ